MSDTTCEIPQALAVELGVETAPLAVITDGVAHTTELDIDTRALYRAMAAAQKVGTAAANVEGFVQAYERAKARLQAAGAERPGILCLALAQELSSTINNARLAAELVEGAEVRVVDSRSAVFAQGALVLEAARRAAAGAGFDELAEWASGAAEAACSYFATPSLRILQGIGRVAQDAGAGSGGEGSATALPKYALVRIREGGFVPFGSARDDDEAVAKLIAAAKADGFGAEGGGGGGAGGARGADAPDGASTEPGAAAGAGTGTAASHAGADAANGEGAAGAAAPAAVARARRGPLRAFFCHTLNYELTDRLQEAVLANFPVVGFDRRDDGALTAVLMGGTGGAGFGLLPVGARTFPMGAGPLPAGAGADRP